MSARRPDTIRGMFDAFQDAARAHDAKRNEKPADDLPLFDPQPKENPEMTDTTEHADTGAEAAALMQTRLDRMEEAHAAYAECDEARWLGDLREAYYQHRDEALALADSHPAAREVARAYGLPV